MKPFEHGGAVVQAARELGLSPGDILDFSASINPLGMPEAVARAAREAVGAAAYHPEVDAASLCAALADFHGLSAPHFLPGHGVTELIYHFPRVLRPRRALLVVPAFSEYERSLQQAGTEIDYFPLHSDNGFTLDVEDLLHALQPDTELVLLANPGNPTGVGIDPAVVERIVHSVREQALVAVDETFVEFCPHRSILARVPQHGNLYVFRSFSNFYAVPGLRGAYLAGPARGIARLALAHPPWSLSVPTLAAAKACLAAADYRQHTLALLPGLRQELAGGLAALGLHVFAGEANFLLARLERPGLLAGELASALRARGILIRDCANFPFLDEHFLRVAVRSAEENARLLAALAELLA